MKRSLPWLFLCWALLPISCLSLGPEGQQADEATIESYSREAEEALARKDAGAAIVALEKLAHLTPNNPEVYANLGAVYYARGRYAQAAEAFQRALRLDPKMPNVPLMLGLCDAELGRSQEAVPILESAFRHPPSAEMGRTIGLKLIVVYTSMGQPTKALETIETLLGRNPNDPEVLYRASHLYGDRALQTMMRLAQVAPESVWKQMAFAEALEGEKRYDLAIIEYQKVIAADPDMAGVHYRLGRAMLLKAPDSEGARQAALKEFQQDLAVEPNNGAAEYEFGEICRRRGQFEPARDHFSRAVEIDPNIEDAQIALARTLIQLQKPKASLPHLLAAIQINPKNELSHFLLARAYQSLGDSAGYQHEMTLYQKYHSQPYADKPGQEEQAPQALTTPEVTKQSLDSEAPPQP